MARRAEQDGVVLPDQVAAVGRHHAAVLLVVFAAPVEVIDLEGEVPFALGQRLQHLDTGGDHLGPDAVSRNRSDRVGLHLGRPSLKSRLSPRAK